ncbi:MAG: TolC family protein, partial [Opitutaceae bacterium]
TVTAAGLPNLSAAGSYQYSDITTFQTSPTPMFFPEGRFWRMNFIVSQTVFAGGGVRSAMRGAERSREAAMLDFQATVNDALLGVQIRFYDVLLAREQIKVQEQSLQLLERQLADTTSRAQAGTVSEFERLRAEVAVANARTPLIRARNDFRLAVEELRRALGFTTNEPASSQKVPEFVGSLEFSPTTFDLQAAFDAAQKNRPDLQRLGKLVASLEEGVTTARADYFPKVAVSGGGELRKGATNSFGDSVDGLRAGVQSQSKVFNRATTGAVMQATSQLEQARLTEPEARLAAEVEVATRDLRD